MERARKKTKVGLPDGLLGLRSLVFVQIKGIYAKALLDSGSQVTLVYHSLRQVFKAPAIDTY